MKRPEFRLSFLQKEKRTLWAFYFVPVSVFALHIVSLRAGLPNCAGRRSYWLSGLGVRIVLQTKQNVHCFGNAAYDIRCRFLNFLWTVWKRKGYIRFFQHAQIVEGIADGRCKIPGFSDLCSECF